MCPGLQRSQSLLAGRESLKKAKNILKPLLVDMVAKEITTEKNGIQPAVAGVTLGKPPRDAVSKRIVMTKFRQILNGEERGLEELAALEHSQWAGWMRYLFSKCYQGNGGALIIPPHLVARWHRQMDTTYEQLPPEEKESDRVEARKVLGLNWLEEPQSACKVGDGCGKESP